MKLSPIAIIGLIAGGVLVALVPTLQAIFPNQSVLIGTVLGPSGLLVVLAGILKQFLQPAASIVADAPVVESDGTPTGATNISSSSTLLPPKA
jgi:hypothetical protein